MADTINGVERYAQNFVITTYADLDDRMSRPKSIEVGFVANTSVAAQYFAAPGDGKLAAVVVQGSVTSDATKTYTFTVENGTQTMLLGANVLYDADPILTADTAAYPALNATAANLAVSAGDIIEVTMTGGTGSGNASVLLVFDLDG
jgi:hypothetical protein